LPDDGSGFFYGMPAGLDGRWMQGEVHDPRAHLLGGVAEYTGLFSPAGDLALYAQMLALYAQMMHTQSKAP